MAMPETIVQYHQLLPPGKKDRRGLSQPNQKYFPFEMICSYCGKNFIPNRVQLRAIATGRQKSCYCSYDCSRLKHKNRMKGAGNSHWKGGKVIQNGGYVFVRFPGRNNVAPYVGEHILIMESFLGRKLKPKECVHHINGDKKDNRIENLQ